MEVVRGRRPESGVLVSNTTSSFHLFLKRKSLATGTWGNEPIARPPGSKQEALITSIRNHAPLVTEVNQRGNRTKREGNESALAIGLRPVSPLRSEKVKLSKVKVFVLLRDAQHGLRQSDIQLTIIQRGCVSFERLRSRR